MLKLSRLKLSARLCSLGLNPDAAPPLARLMCRHSDLLTRLSRIKLSARLCNFGLSWSDSCPDFADLLSRFSRLKLSETLCNLDLNPDAASPLARLMCRHSIPSVQTFQTQTLGASLQFWSLSGCGATPGVTLVKTFQTLYPDFPD